MRHIKIRTGVVWRTFDPLPCHLKAWLSFSNSETLKPAEIKLSLLLHINILVINMHTGHTSLLCQTFACSSTHTHTHAHTHTAATVQAHVPHPLPPPFLSSSPEVEEAESFRAEVLNTVRHTEQNHDNWQMFTNQAQQLVQWWLMKRTLSCTRAYWVSSGLKVQIEAGGCWSARMFDYS